jgi:hypothetical protein
VWPPAADPRNNLTVHSSARSNPTAKTKADDLTDFIKAEAEADAGDSTDESEGLVDLNPNTMKL